MTSARLILAGLAVLLVAGLLTQRQSAPPGTAIYNDPHLYRTVVERMTDGAPYYDARGAEMRARGFPLRSVFNWRLPALYCGLAHAKVPMLVLFGAMLFGLLVGALELAAKQPLAGMLMMLVMTAGVMVTTANLYAVHLSETWAGLFLALSALAYARGWPVAGALICIAGLFVRELLAPFALAAAGLSLWHRRGREIGVWFAGGIAILVYTWWHAQMALAHMLPGDPAQPQSWIQFGGLPFLLSAISFGGWLMVAPWLAPIACVLLIACVWSKAPVHLKAAVVAYALFFLVVGQPKNRGWGMMVAPTFAHACGVGVSVLHGLWRSDAIPNAATPGI